MTTRTDAALKQTALHAAHKAAGARMVDFAGWDMPVEYSGITQEHLAVRTAAGLFDVSHMGEIEIRGVGALALVQHVTSNDASQLKDSQAQYTALMLENGAAIDDCLVHKVGDENYFLCVNAANEEKDFDWIRRAAGHEATVRDVSDEYSQIALQGPRSAAILARTTKTDLSQLRYYWFTNAECCGVRGILARTGYTGEDGFEFYFPPQHSRRVWEGLTEAGKPDGLVPCGLGARNTLRLEAAYPLYGHELDEQTTLLEAGLGWICKLGKGEFIGRQALVEQREKGLRKKLIGFEMTDRGIARDGYDIYIAGRRAGKVTSGSPAPFLKKNIGLAYVPPEQASAGAEIQIDIRGRMVAAKQVTLPFYKRPKS
ncbi:MAG: glycine cleavage system aminomethyltransferase GcvT [Deltaproteobacteria bacterium]